MALCVSRTTDILFLVATRSTKVPGMCVLAPLSASMKALHGPPLLSEDQPFFQIRVVKHLVSLKERHPERVFLILGNRDINKLRFGSELGAEGCADRASDGRHIYWDPKCKSYDDYVSERGYDADGSAEDVKILKWMLFVYYLGSYIIPTSFSYLSFKRVP